MPSTAVGFNFVSYKLASLARFQIGFRRNERPVWKIDFRENGFLIPRTRACYTQKGKKRRHGKHEESKQLPMGATRFYFVLALYFVGTS